MSGTRLFLQAFVFSGFAAFTTVGAAEAPAALCTANPDCPTGMTDAMTALEHEQADLAINLAHSLAREKKFREALSAYQEFVRVFPMSLRRAEARENMARIYERRQRYDLAIGQYDALYRELGISQLALAYRLEAARLHEIAGNESAAVAIYQEINRIDAGSEAAARARTRMEAIHLLQKAGEPQGQLVNSSPQNE